MALSSTSEKARMLTRLLANHAGAATVLMVMMLMAALAESFGLSLVLPLITTLSGLEAGITGPLANITALLSRLMPADAQIDGLLALLAIAFLVKGVLMVSTKALSVNFAMKLRQNWVARLMDHYLSANYAYLAAQRHGTTVHNITVEPYRAALSIIVIFDFINRLMLAIVLAAVLLVANWQVTLTITAFGFLVFFVIRRGLFRYAAKFGKQRIKLQQEISAIATESAGSALQIKLFGAYAATLEALEERLAKHRRIETVFQAFNTAPAQSTEFVIILFLSVGMMVLSHGFDLEPAAYLALIGFYVVIGQRLLTTLNFLVSRRMKIAAMIPSLVLVDDLLEAAPSREALDAGETFEGLKQDIEVRQLGFSHDGVPVFTNLNMTIKRGATTAIVGPSGVGKSTLADMLLGLHRPESGRIMINGHDIRTYSLASLRQRIGYVSQEPELFHAGIGENIQLGRLDATRADIVDAAKKANIHDFIKSLADGYETVVGDRGVKLSGGQRQRLTIARVILRQPDVYIFDEATSSLDTESEQLIQQAIEELGREATVVVIAHRLTTIKNADVIYQLDGSGGARESSYREVSAQPETSSPMNRPNVAP